MWHNMFSTVHMFHTFPSLIINTFTKPENLYLIIPSLTCRLPQSLIVYLQTSPLPHCTTPFFLSLQDLTVTLSFSALVQTHLFLTISPLACILVQTHLFLTISPLTCIPVQTHLFLTISPLTCIPVQTHLFPTTSPLTCILVQTHLFLTTSPLTCIPVQTHLFLTISPLTCIPVQTHLLLTIYPLTCILHQSLYDLPTGFFTFAWLFKLSFFLCLSTPLFKSICSWSDLHSPLSYLSL